MTPEETSQDKYPSIDTISWCQPNPKDEIALGTKLIAERVEQLQADSAIFWTKMIMHGTSMRFSDGIAYF